MTLPPAAVQHGMARGGVPFHGASGADIDVGLARRHQAEFQRRSGADELATVKRLRNSSVAASLWLRLPTATSPPPGRARLDAPRRVDDRWRFPAPRDLESAAGVAEEQPRLGRGIDHARHRDAVHHFGDVDRELAIAVEKFAGAVQGIDQEEMRAGIAAMRPAAAASSAATGTPGNRAPGRPG